MTRGDAIVGRRATPEDEELIRWRGAPGEMLVRFRYGDKPHRRVKAKMERLDELMQRCKREFG